jgi:sugar phosphate isomerase/epimerase
MTRQVLAVQLYTLRAHTQTLADLRATLKKVADIGYTAVELSAVEQLDPQDVARALADHGLKAVSAHTAWERFPHDLDAVIAEYRLWDCRRLVIAGLPGEYYSAAGLQRFLRELPPVTARLAAAGIDFVYHNHSHELARLENGDWLRVCAVPVPIFDRLRAQPAPGPSTGAQPRSLSPSPPDAVGGHTWLAQLFDRTDPRQVKAELDTYWIQHGGGDPAAWIRRYAGRVPLLHLKDMCITPQREQRYAEVGAGNLNWPAILAAAADAGVECYIVEQDECYARDPFDSVALSFRFLHSLGLR